jgi:hypothetical protein
MRSCNPCHTSMEHHLKLSKTSSAPPVDATEYRGLVSYLRYLSRFMEFPTTEHYNVVKRILRYIAGTIDFGCHYHRGGKELRLLGYSDTDMGGDVDTRKSTTSVVFYLGSSPVTWQS